MGITDTQSFSLVIADVFHDAVASDPFFANYYKSKTKMLSVQHQQLPYLGVYIIDETMLPDGDANAGSIRFSHTLRIGFSAVIAMNDPSAARLQLNAAWWAIMNRLWPDQYIMNLIDTHNPTTDTENPDNTIIESITRGVVRYVYGAQALNNETPLAEMQYDVSVFFRTRWEPAITDTLDEIDWTTGVKAGDTQADMDQRLQVHGKYLFDISKRPTKKERRR